MPCQCRGLDQLYAAILYGPDFRTVDEQRSYPSLATGQEVWLDELCGQTSNAAGRALWSVELGGQSKCAATRPRRLNEIVNHFDDEIRSPY